MPIYHDDTFFGKKTKEEEERQLQTKNTYAKKQNKNELKISSSSDGGKLQILLPGYQSGNAMKKKNI